MLLKLDLVRQALIKLARPMVRLALHSGLKHADLDQVVRTLLVDEAKRLMQSKGQRAGNVSQLAAITGIHRKDLTVRVKQPDVRLMNTQMSVPSRVYTRWLQLCRERPQLARLTVFDANAAHSFEQLVKQETRGDVHYKTVLDELLRLGLAQVVDDSVEINANGFVPSNDFQMMLAFLADNGRDHLLAAVTNVTETPGHYLERSVFADDLSREDCEKLQAKARAQWNNTHATLFDDLLQGDPTRVSEPGHQGEHRMRVGIYAYYEPMEKPGSAADEQP